MNTKFKKTVLIDLDGVLNTYTGEFNEQFIPPIKERASEFLKKISENYRIKIFTTRNRLLASQWIINNGLDNFVEDVTSVKEPCFLYIDDRCVCFDGDFTALKNNIEKFRVWYK